MISENKNLSMRIARDTMGEVAIPYNAYYGAQTQRAVENFSISGIRLPRIFIRALGLIKKHAATANADLGLLDKKLHSAIVQAADEVANGKLFEQFVVDVFQTGSGTSTNMNANEVITARANELITGQRHSANPVHSNDHVNMGQSSNDVIPSAIRIAAMLSLKEELLPSLRTLFESLRSKAMEFDEIIKIGRTHLQDAVPIRLGQEFSGYARQVELGIERITMASRSLEELALGGTAVGTGLNTHPQFAGRVIEKIVEETGLVFREAENHFEAQAAQDGIAYMSGALKTVAISLSKIANDIRWLSSGPRCGIGEISIPSLQPGSSIMPGKVNPVVPECVLQVAAQVVGNDAAIAIGCQNGNFELNTMLPVIAHNLLQSIELLATSARTFACKCVNGITANEGRCHSLIEGSLAMCTSLAPVIGYESAAAIAKEAFETGTSVREVALKKKVLPYDALEKLLDPADMTRVRD